MKNLNDRTEVQSDSDASPSGGRAPYTPPRLDRLGAWSALTLQQSIPIFP